MDPETKTSNSISVFSLIDLISSNDNSRAKTTRDRPMDFKS